MKQIFFTSVLLLFIVLSAVFYWLKSAAPAFNFTVLMAGNVIMLVLSVITYFLVTKKIHSGNPNAFVRGVYASSFLKLFICVVAIVTYAIVNKPDIHKPSLFTLFGVYMVYSVVETMMLSRLARQAK